MYNESRFVRTYEYNTQIYGHLSIARFIISGENVPGEKSKLQTLKGVMLIYKLYNIPFAFIFSIKSVWVYLPAHCTRGGGV